MNISAKNSSAVLIELPCCGSWIYFDGIPTSQNRKEAGVQPNSQASIYYSFEIVNYQFGMMDVSVSFRRDRDFCFRRYLMRRIPSMRHRRIAAAVVASNFGSVFIFPSTLMSELARIVRNGCRVRWRLGRQPTRFRH